MSKTSIKERNKAIRLAWEKEQQLVQEGKGTRDWTKEQQKDILDPDKGKAYDENGRAFEGQHMKSAAEYPEYQGDPDNIQFLTREEHLEAHKGSWQNPTNWFYNPDTKEFVDFGDNKPIPCEVLNLSDPVQSPVIKAEDNSSNIGNSDQSEVKSPAEESSQPLQQEKIAHYSEGMSSQRVSAAPQKVHESFGDKILRVVDAIRAFPERHPVLTNVLKAVGIAAVAAGAEAIANSGKGSGGSSRSLSSDDYFNDPSSDDEYADSLGEDDDDDSPSEREYPDERSSPEEHTVRGHGQHYHTKDGVIWKEKEPYPRGGKHEDDQG